MFMKAIAGLARRRGNGGSSTIRVLPDSFAHWCAKSARGQYRRDGTDRFLKSYGPAQYHSAAEYEKVMGSRVPATIIGGGKHDIPPVRQTGLETDPNAEADYFAHKRRALAAYGENLSDRLHLDGLVLPGCPRCRRRRDHARRDGQLSSGRTAIPHGLIGSAFLPVRGGRRILPQRAFPSASRSRPGRGRNGDLLGWAYAYEQQLTIASRLYWLRRVCSLTHRDAFRMDFLGVLRKKN